MSRGSRRAAWVIILGAVVWSAVETEVSLARLIEGLPFMWDFLRRMLPPDLAVLGNAMRGAVETIPIAVVGTVLFFVHRRGKKNFEAKVAAQQQKQVTPPVSTE